MDLFHTVIFFIYETIQNYYPKFMNLNKNNMIHYGNKWYYINTNLVK